MRSQMLHNNGPFEICQERERMFAKQRRTHGWSTHLQSKKIFMLKEKSSNLYMISEWLFIHITLETTPNEMQYDETISHMVTAGRSYFRTWRNVCLTTGKIPHGCFEMLSWPHCTSNHIIRMFLVASDLYEMFILYRGKHATRCLTVGIWSEVRVYCAPVHEYTMRQQTTVGQLLDNRHLMC